MLGKKINTSLMGYQAETQTKHTQLIDEGEACLVLNMILWKYI